MKPCPFCGGKVKVSANPDTMRCAVECSACNVIMKRNFKGSARVAALLRILIAEC